MRHRYRDYRLSVNELVLMLSAFATLAASAGLLTTL